ncbi:hypothetical protein [Pseudomonas brenneri]|uniref:hypothetical protein n=1 Tax=Pseudomonas brenneri TaxID=129817 RepID=UPI0028D73E72|nr:hypothetical protein [Pseudomonas brenneri]
MDQQSKTSGSKTTASSYSYEPAFITLPDDYEERENEKADLLERRLLRVEEALGLDRLT